MSCSLWLLSLFHWRQLRIKNIKRLIFPITGRGGANSVRSSKKVIMTPHTLRVIWTSTLVHKAFSQATPPDHWGDKLGPKSGHSLSPINHCTLYLCWKKSVLKLTLPVIASHIFFLCQGFLENMIQFTEWVSVQIAQANWGNAAKVNLLLGFWRLHFSSYIC